MTILTPWLAAKMLDVWERRQHYPRSTVYDSSILEAALEGVPDHLPTRVNRREPGLPPVFEKVNGKWRKVRSRPLIEAPHFR